MSSTDAPSARRVSRNPGNDTSAASMPWISLGESAARAATANAIASRWSPRPSATPPRSPRPEHHQVVSLHPRVPAQRADAVRHAGEPVALLRSQLGRLHEPRLSPGVRGQQRQDRNLVDHERELRSGDLRAFEFGTRTDPKVADRLAELLAGPAGLRPHTHPAHDLQEMKSARVEADVADGQLRSGHRGRSNEERGGRHIAGHRACERVVLIHALQCDRRPLDGHWRAQGGERPLGVVARRGRLGDRRLPFGRDAGEQDRAFHLGGGDGQSERDAVERPSDDLHGRVAVGGGDRRSHLPQRSRHPLHRPRGEAGIADEHRPERRGGERSGDQSHRGAGVPAVESIHRLGERQSALTLDLKCDCGRFPFIVVPRGTVTLGGRRTVPSPSFECRSTPFRYEGKARSRRANVEGSRKPY